MPNAPQPSCQTSSTRHQPPDSTNHLAAIITAEWDSHPAKVQRLTRVLKLRLSCLVAHAFSITASVHNLTRAVPWSINHDYARRKIYSALPPAPTKGFCCAIGGSSVGNFAFNTFVSVVLSNTELSPDIRNIKRTHLRVSFTIPSAVVVLLPGQTDALLDRPSPSLKHNLQRFGQR